MRKGMNDKSQVGGVTGLILYGCSNVEEMQVKRGKMGKERGLDEERSTVMGRALKSKSKVFAYEETN